MYNPIEEKTKNKGGRPSTYKPEICRKVLEYATNGMTMSMIFLKLGISEGTCRYWKKKYPEFLRTIKIAKTIRQAAWVEIGRLNLFSKDFNNVLWMMNMSNQFQWHSSNSKIDKDVHKEIKKLEINVNYSEENNAKLAKVAGILQSVGAISSETIEVKPDPETN